MILTKKTKKDKLIEKYGEEEGLKKYNNWYNNLCKARKKQYNVEYWIEKFGPIDGPKKLKEYKNKTSGSKERYIKKYGEEEGLKKYNDFRKKCSIFVMSDDAKEKYKNRKNVVSFEYFLEKTNGNYEEAVLLYKDRQNASSLDKFIKKYGEEIGTQRYKETNIKKLKNFEGKSEFEIKFIEELINKLDKKYECYYGNNKFMFFTDKIFKKQSGKKVIIADLYIKDLNLCIEIYGDFWHLNPIKFEYDFYSNFHKKLANEVWKEDSDRINFLKKKYNIDTIVVWENEIRTNRQKVIKLLLEKINGIYKTSEKISNNKN